MTQKEKIKNYIKENTTITNKDIQTIITIELITNALENKGLINFSFNEYMFTSEEERWLQCEYMSKIGKAVIFDCGVVEENWKTINEFVDKLIEYHKEIKKLEKKITFIN